MTAPPGTNALSQLDHAFNNMIKMQKEIRLSTYDGIYDRSNSLRALAIKTKLATLNILCESMMEDVDKNRELKED